MLGFKVLALLRTTLSFQTYTRGVSRILTKITNCVLLYHLQEVVISLYYSNVL